MPSPGAYGINLVAPLAFLAVLVPLVRTRSMLLVAVAAGATAYVVSLIAPGGVAVLGAGLAGCLVGAWLLREERTLEAPSLPQAQIGAPSPQPPPPGAGEGEQVGRAS